MAVSLKAVVPASAEAAIAAEVKKAKKAAIDAVAPEYEISKLHNGQLEFMTLTRLVLDEDLRTRLWARLTDDHFAADTTSAIYHRLRTLVAAGREFPSLQTLAMDPALTPAAQAQLGGLLARIERGQKVTSGLVTLDGGKAVEVETSADFEGLVFDLLDGYRVTRQATEAFVDAVKEIAEDKSFDPLKGPELVEKAANKVMALRGREALAETLLHFGHLTTHKDDEHRERELKRLFEKDLPRFKTGFQIYDAKAGGFQPGEVVLVGAGTGQGKSALLLSLMVNMARSGTPVAMLQLELSPRQIHERLSACLSSVDSGVIRTGKCSDRDQVQIRESWAEFHSDLDAMRSRLSVFAPSQATLTEVELVFKTYPYKVWFIDYVNLLNHDGGVKGRAGEDHTRLSDIIVALKRLAKKYGIVVVCAVQVNIDKESGDIDIRYSRAMKEHSDITMVWNLTKEAREDGVVWIRHLKARQYEPFDFPVRVALNYCRFESMNPTEQPKTVRRKLGKQQATEEDLFVKKPKAESQDVVTPVTTTEEPVFAHTAPSATGEDQPVRVSGAHRLSLEDLNPYEEYDDE